MSHTQALDQEELGCDGSRQSAPADSAVRARHMWGAAWVVLGVGGLGLLLRVIAYVRGGSLWIDEARLAINIAGRPALGLLAPLDHDQSSPVLFLWAEKLAIAMLGVSHYALRLLPLMAGLVTVVLVFHVGRAFASQRAATTAAFMAAISPTLIEYSNQVKQYGIEAMVTLVLVGIATRFLRQPADQQRRVVLLGVGAGAVWLSAPAVFVLAAILLAMLVAAQSRRGVTWAMVAEAAALWAASFAIAFYFVYRHASLNLYMQRYWEMALLVPGHGYWDRLCLALRSVFWGTLVGREPQDSADVGTRVFLWTVNAVLAGTVVLSLAHVLRRRDWTALALLAGPVGAAAVASTVGSYPFALRTMVFAAPLLLVLAVLGLDALARWHYRRLALVAGLLVVAVVIVAPASLAVYQIVLSPVREDMRSLVDQLSARQRPGDLVYVFAGSIPAYEFYTTDWSSPDTTRVAMLNRAAGSEGPAFQNKPSRGHAVRDEGQDLIWKRRGGMELLGVPTGIEVKALYGALRTVPDSGWAAYEAGRIIRLMGRSDAWLVLSQFTGPELSLIAELEHRGGRAMLVAWHSSDALVHYHRE